MKSPAAACPSSRREFIVSAASAAALAVTRPAGGATPPGSGYIDAHSHVWTPDTGRYPRAAAFAAKKAPEPASFTPAELFAHCRPVGVARVVLIQMSFYQYDNRYMLDAIATHPSVFRGVAVVDENAPQVPDTLRRLARAGVTGIRLYADQERAETWSNATAMQALWRAATEQDIAVCPLAHPEALPAIHRMIERHPRTRVVIDHCARIGARTPVNERDLDRLCALARFEHVHVKTSAFYALGEKKAPYTDLGPMIRRLRDAFGAADVGERLSVPGAERTHLRRLDRTGPRPAGFPLRHRQDLDPGKDSREGVLPRRELAGLKVERTKPGEEVGTRLLLPRVPPFNLQLSTPSLRLRPAPPGRPAAARYRPPCCSRARRRAAGPRCA